jgi:hypothetical protein
VSGPSLREQRVQRSVADGWADFEAWGQRGEFKG